MDIDKRLTQKELFPLFKLLRNVEINIYYFEKYANKFITRKFYADNNTDNIVYDKFKIEFAGYEDVAI